jgi:hypothetical protein
VPSLFLFDADRSHNFSPDVPESTPFQVVSDDASFISPASVLLRVYFIFSVPFSIKDFVAILLSDDPTAYSLPPICHVL